MKPSKRILNVIRRIQILQMKLYEEDNQAISLSLETYYCKTIPSRHWSVCINNADYEGIKIWHIYEDTSLEEIENIFNEMYDLIGFVF